MNGKERIPGRPEIAAKYIARTQGSRAAHAKALKRLPGGINRNITHFSPYPLFVAEGQGQYLHDVDGNRYVDMIGNYTSMIFGHAHAETVDAAVQALERGSGWAAASPMEYDLAEMIGERIPSMKQTRFTSSGTEATMMAIRAARAATGRSLIAKFEGGYHGQHDYAVVSLAPDLVSAGTRHKPEAVAPRGVPVGVRESVIVLPFNDPDAVQELLAQHAQDLAGVIVEPIMGVAGMIEPQPGFLARLRELTRQHGIVLIFDEVISFRVRYGGAQELYGVGPDLTTLGKIIGGGLPIGALGGDPEIMGVFDPTQSNPVMLSGTFHANPVSLAAGVATLRAFDKSTVEALNSTSTSLFARMRRLIENSPQPLRLNCVGSLFNLHFTDTPVVDYRSAVLADKELLGWLQLALLNRGFLVAPRGLGCLSVPMIEADLDRFLTALEEALSDVAQDL